MLALERLSFPEQEGKVGYRWGRDTADQETMNYLEFFARVTSHIPDKGQVAAIDIAARLAIYYRHGYEGRFIDRRGRSQRRTKRKIL